MPESYLCLAGNEISNSMRTLTYLLRGLAGPEFDVGTVGANPVGLISGYSDIYTDTYGGDVSLASMLACYCADLDDASNFTSPAADPAPWYDPTHADHAGEFLGLILDSVDLGTGASRSVAARSSGGGSMGRLRVKPRVMAFHGHMFASTAQGMAWGERWLNKVLAGSMCGDCGGDSAEVLPSCSAGGPSQFRTLYEVGLVDGPVPTPILGRGGPGHRMQEVSFQLAAGNPYLHRNYSFPFAPASAFTLSGAGDHESFPVVTGEWMGEVAVTLTITAVGNVNGLVIEAVPLTEGADCDYNPAASGNVCARYVVNNLADGDSLVIDATNRRVTRIDNTSKAVVSGFENLVFEGPFPWLIVPPCSNTCVSFVNGSSGGAHVSLLQQEREL